MGIRITPTDDRARALLDLVATGNQVAFEEFYRLLSQRVFSFVRRMVDTTELADEIMVETMYEVWRTASRFRGDSQVSTWVLGIARNKVLMAIRSRGADRTQDIDNADELVDVNAPDAFEEVAKKELSDIILGCVRKLGPKHRECIHLTHYEEMSMPEVAEVLGIPEGTVKSRLSHARAQLAACVDVALRRGRPEKG